MPPLTEAAKSKARCHGRSRQAIVRSLLREICDGRLHPGERLVTQSLAERFRVSHTPIREALIELAGVGIVDHMPNRGAVVRLITSRDVREVYQVRRALECAAVRSASGRIELGLLHRLAADIRRLKATPPRGLNSIVERACEIDSRLHDLIAESSGNSLLAREIGRLKTLFRAFRDVAWQRDEARNDTHRLAEECDEHLAIVEALLARDAKAAVRAMARHISSGNRYWSRAMPSKNGKRA